MIAPVFDEIPAYEQAFSHNLLFFQHPREIGFDKGIFLLYTNFSDAG